MDSTTTKQTLYIVQQTRRDNQQDRDLAIRFHRQLIPDEGMPKDLNLPYTAENSQTGLFKTMDDFLRKVSWIRSTTKSNELSVRQVNMKSNN